MSYTSLRLSVLFLTCWLTKGQQVISSAFFSSAFFVRGYSECKISNSNEYSFYNPIQNPFWTSNQSSNPNFKPKPWLNFKPIPWPNLNQTLTEPWPNLDQTSTYLDRNSTEPRPIFDQTSTELQPNLDQTLTVPQPNLDRTSTKPRRNLDQTECKIKTRSWSLNSKWTDQQVRFYLNFCTLLSLCTITCLERFWHICLQWCKSYIFGSLVPCGISYVLHTRTLATI